MLQRGTAENTATNGNNGTNGRNKRSFRLFCYFRLFRILFFISLVAALPRWAPLLNLYLPLCALFSLIIALSLNKGYFVIFGQSRTLLYYT
jgi:hypothetical protein